MIRSASCLLFLLSIVVPPARGQEEPDERGPVGGPGLSDSACVGGWSYRTSGIGSASEELLRVLEVAGAAPLRPSVNRRPSSDRTVPFCGDPDLLPWGGRLEPRREDSGPTFELLPAGSRTHYNSAYPNDRNNGALWAGRGLSTRLQAGALVRWGALSAALAPGLAFQQNREFEVPEALRNSSSPFAHPRWAGVIDLPHRFGPDPYWTLDPGQSFVRVDAHNLALGLSTENLWWGPGIRNSILMSNTAAGFPHLFLGTSRPADVWIGKLEAQLLWGRLRESKYFDSDPANDRRLLASLMVDFEPRPLPGLFLGLVRVLNYNLTDEGVTAQQLLAPLSSSLLTDRIRDYDWFRLETNQLASVFARWVHPASGFELFAEWANEDYRSNLNDLAQEPDHSQAFILGFQKVAAAGDRRWVRLQGELTHLQERIAHREGRPTPTYYVHSQIRQGYTHEGQLLGAAIGPGSDSQYLGVDLFGAGGRAGIFAERVRRNETLWYSLGMPDSGHDVELTAGVRHLFPWKGVDFAWELAHSFRRNRDLLKLEERYLGPSLIEGTERNWSARVEVDWWPGARR